MSHSRYLATAVRRGGPGVWCIGELKCVVTFLACPSDLGRSARRRAWPTRVRGVGARHVRDAAARGRLAGAMGRSSTHRCFVFQRLSPHGPPKGTAFHYLRARRSIGAPKSLYIIAL